MTLAPEKPTTPTFVEPPTNPAIFYDPLSYAAYDHPYEVYRQLRDNAPVYYNARRDLWVVSRYADVSACLKNHEQMVNALGNDMDGTHDSYGTGNLVAQDQPPTRRAAGRGAALIRGAGNPGDGGPHPNPGPRAAGRAAERGGGDLATEFAIPLVFSVSLRLMGIDGSDSSFWEQHLMRSMVRTVGEFGIPAGRGRVQPGGRGPPGGPDGAAGRRDRRWR